MTELKRNTGLSIYCLLLDFNQDGRPDNIGFMIKRVKVHSEDALRDPNYRFPGNYGVEKYLELFSGKNICKSQNSDGVSIQIDVIFLLDVYIVTEEDYDTFCLAYMFTYRDFEMGTLGLAWTGDLKNAGGVCEKNGVRSFGAQKLINI